MEGGWSGSWKPRTPAIEFHCSHTIGILPHYIRTTYQSLSKLQLACGDDLVKANVYEQMGILRRDLAEEDVAKPSEGVAICGGIFDLDTGGLEVLEDYVCDGEMKSF